MEPRRTGAGTFGPTRPPPSGDDRTEAPTHRRWVKLLLVAAAALVAVGVLYLTWRVALSGQLVLAAGVLGTGALGLWVYLARPAYTWRYLFPGVLGMLVFVIFPLLYTVRLGFTNYSSPNLLTFQAATQYLLDETEAGPGTRYEFALHPAKDGVRLVFTPAAEGDAAAPPAGVLATPPIDPARPPEALEAAPVPAGEALGEPLALRELIRHRAALARLQVRFPDGTIATMASLREFAPLRPVWVKGERGALVRSQTGEAIVPDMKTGFYETAAGERVQPGFKVDVGLANYARVLTDPAIGAPLLRIFAWTVAFALLTVLFTLAVGLTLAVVLNWEALPGRTAYRTLLFLPYAVPAFISILVFKGIFSSQGELNQILAAVLGAQGPAWFADPWLARLVILIVNTWLGYPYILVLSTGLIKAIPSELYEASAMAGAGPLQTFRHVTAPLIIRPLTPLLVASFAFNFNNFVLISLLTQGRPDFLDARVPAGTTDILVSYTYRLAFEDSGQQFGLAAAISTAIFVLVTCLSVVNLRLTRGRVEDRPR